MTLKFSFGGTTFDLVLLSPESRTSLVSARFVNRTGSNNNLDRDAILELNDFTGTLIISHQDPKCTQHDTQQSTTNEIHPIELAKRWSPPNRIKQQQQSKDIVEKKQEENDDDDFYCSSQEQNYKNEHNNNPLSLHKKNIQSHHPDNIISNDLPQSSKDKITSNYITSPHDSKLTTSKSISEGHPTISKHQGQTENKIHSTTSDNIIDVGERKSDCTTISKVVSSSWGSYTINSNTSSTTYDDAAKENKLQSIQNDYHHAIIPSKINNINSRDDTNHGFTNTGPSHATTNVKASSSSSDGIYQSKESKSFAVQETNHQYLGSNCSDSNTAKRRKKFDVNSGNIHCSSPENKVLERGIKKRLLLLSSVDNDDMENNYRNVKFKIPRKERGL